MKSETSVRKHTTITIPKPMFERMKRMIQHTGFGSVSDYATYLLREVLVDIENSSKAKGKSEEKGVIKKLKALGYV